MRDAKETKFCKYCQSQIPAKAKVCPNCRKKQGGKLKWVILAVVVLLGIVMAAGGSGDSAEDDVIVTNPTENVDATANTDAAEDADAAENTDDAENTEEEAADSNQLTVGSSLEKKGLKITVNEADTNFTDYDDEYGWHTPEENMKYVMVSFTFENNGDSDAYVSIYDFDCYADNTICEQKYGLDDSDFINTNLSSGRNVTFKTYYSVPVDAQSIELEYETNVWTNEKAIIKLQ